MKRGKKITYPPYLFFRTMSNNLKLYTSILLSDCIDVLIHLHENKIDFELHEVDIVEKEEHKEQWFHTCWNFRKRTAGNHPTFFGNSNRYEWFIDMSPCRILPVLKSDDFIFIGSSSIKKWIGRKMFHDDDGVMNNLSEEKKNTNHEICDILKEKGGCGVSLTCAMIAGLYTETHLLRYPFHQQSENKTKIINALRSVRSSTEFDGDLTVEDLINNNLFVLKALEDHLSNESKIGVWLHGSSFSSSDCTMTSYLLQLYTLGLDQFWNDGELPHVAIYWTQARQRPSVLKASLWKEHEHQYCTIDKEPNEVKQARFACYSAVALGGAYLLFRALKK